MNPDVMSQPSRDPYSVLGLSRQADDEDIKRAYFQLVRQFSPERAPEQFREIRTAYEQLRDPENRARLGLFLVQLPPPLPKHRRPSYDLSVHVEDLLTLAMELVRTPMQDDFNDITCSTAQAEVPRGRETRWT